jgi:hypothetical protein
MRYVLLILGLFVFSSCAALPHLNEALTLKDYSDEKVAQQAAVSGRDRKFDEMVAMIKNGGSLANYKTKADFIVKFGNPVLAERVTLEDGSEGERFLYRHATQYFDGPKVYVVFDKQGNVRKIDPEIESAQTGQPAH